MWSPCLPRNMLGMADKHGVHSYGKIAASLSDVWRCIASIDDRVRAGNSIISCQCTPIDGMFYSSSNPRGPVMFSLPS